MYDKSLQKHANNKRNAVVNNKITLRLNRFEVVRDIIDRSAMINAAMYSFGVESTLGICEM